MHIDVDCGLVREGRDALGGTGRTVLFVASQEEGGLHENGHSPADNNNWIMRGVLWHCSRLAQVESAFPQLWMAPIHTISIEKPFSLKPLPRVRNRSHNRIHTSFFMMTERDRNRDERIKKRTLIDYFMVVW